MGRGLAPVRGGGGAGAAAGALAGVWEGGHSTSSIGLEHRTRQKQRSRRWVCPRGPAPNEPPATGAPARGAKASRSKAAGGGGRTVRTEVLTSAYPPAQPCAR